MGCDLTSIFGVNPGNPYEKLYITWKTPPEFIDLTLDLPDTVRRGENIPLKLTLQHNGEDPVMLGIGGYGPDELFYNFIIATSDSLRVWARVKYYYPYALEDILGLDTLLYKGDIMEFEHIWDQRDEKGKRVSPGKYLVFGVIHGWINSPDPAEHPEWAVGDFGTEGKRFVIE